MKEIGRMEQFERLSIDGRINYLLSLMEWIIDDISDSEGYQIAVQSLEKCREWVRDKRIEADDLYCYLENMDEIDVMTYMGFAKDENSERVWICLANALAYTIWAAYQYEGKKYMPETIECVDHETIEDFFRNFEQVYTEKKE